MSKFLEADKLSFRIWAVDHPMFNAERLTNTKLFKRTLGIDHDIALDNFVIETNEWWDGGFKDWSQWGRDISWEDRRKENLANGMWLILK